MTPQPVRPIVVGAEGSDDIHGLWDQWGDFLAAAAQAEREPSGGYADLPFTSTWSTLVPEPDCPVDPSTSEQTLRPVSDGRGGTAWTVASD